MLSKERYAEFEWIYDEQKYYHKPCDCYAEDHKCIMCQTETPDSFTWSDILEFIRQRGFDNDEYFSMSRNYDKADEARPGMQVFAKGSNNPAVYWVKGGSEGWYVHVDRIFLARYMELDKLPPQERSKYFPEFDSVPKCIEVEERDLMLLGKFWDSDRAAEACKAITEFIYGVVSYARHEIIG